MRKGGRSSEMSERQPGERPEVCVEGKRKTTTAPAGPTGTCEPRLYSKRELSVLSLRFRGQPRLKPVAAVSLESKGKWYEPGKP